MSKISKFVKLNKNVLLEYIYNDGNLISEPYNILVNSKTLTKSYLAFDGSGTGNELKNQLISLDPIQMKYGNADPNKYSFLSVQNYASGQPVRHDTLKFHMPVNWTFGEYLGFYVRLYTMDSTNREKVVLSNFYFNMTDVNQQNLLKFTSPPMLFQEKMWGKSIDILIPSVSELSRQLTNATPTSNSINHNLTNGVGISINAPIFIDFHFIKDVSQLNGNVIYKLGSVVTSTVPQTPEFESLGLMIKHSDNGDFFEIFGMFNGTSGGFKKFIDDAYYMGNRYYVQYNITVYEQNIRGKTQTITVLEDFNEPIEYRPIIKYSTTTAIIDVEMRLIDSVDESYILRRASYGMLQDEVAKYSLNMMKINLSNANKPKIYNIKSSINPELVGISNAFGMIEINNKPKVPYGIRIDYDNLTTNTVVEKIEIPYPVLIDRKNIMSRSSSAEKDGEKYYGFNKMEIVLHPFDNIIGFSIATGEDDTKIEFMDLSRFDEIKLIFKDSHETLSFDIFNDSKDVDLGNGYVVFKISESKYTSIEKMSNRGTDSFYIVGIHNSTSSVIYNGIFRLQFDETEVIADIPIVDIEPPIIVKPTITAVPNTVLQSKISLGNKLSKVDSVKLTMPKMTLNQDVLKITPFTGIKKIIK